MISSKNTISFYTAACGRMQMKQKIQNGLLFYIEKFSMHIVNAN